MKVALRYQMSEYDCGPTALLNAISFLFEREEITPSIIRNIMLYSLDTYDGQGGMGTGGTSATAMFFLGHWLTEYGKSGHLPVSGRYLSGDSVWIGNSSSINDALIRGGAVVMRVLYEVGHYILLTGVDGNKIRVFDSYIEEGSLPEGILEIKDQPKLCNRLVDWEVFNREGLEMYNLGPVENREAVIIFNEKTKITPEKSIEYFI